MIKRKMEITPKTHQGTDSFNFCLTFTEVITSTHRWVLSKLAFVDIFSLSLMDLPLSDHCQHLQTEENGILMILIIRLDTILK